MSRPQGIDPTGAYAYLVRAREKLLDWVRPLPHAQYTQEFPFGHKTIRATLVHVAAAEWAYNRRLRGEEMPPIGDRPFTAFYEGECAPFEQRWRDQADETRRTLAEAGDWARPLEYAVTLSDGRRRRVRATAGGVATQLLFHEVHHRAQVMAMLRQLGIAAENLDYSGMTFQVEDLG